MGRPSPVFSGRNRPTPFGLYKIKKREGGGRRMGKVGAGRRMGKVGAQDGPQSIVVKPRSYTGSVWHGFSTLVVKPRSYTGSVWHGFSTLVISTNYSFRSDSDQNE